MIPQESIENRIYAITRPHSSLMLQYFVWSLSAFIFFPLFLIPLFFKYHTLRYRFDDEGISMRWGVFFRREINLTYRRIQDIHLTRGLVERWLGLGSLGIQTASGSASAEMLLQGLKEYEEVREFLYTRMRGRKEAAAPAIAGESAAPAASGEALELLRAIHADLQVIRRGGNRPAETDRSARPSPDELS